MRRLYFTDSVIVWLLRSYTASAEPIFDAPLIIKARWDQLRTENSVNDKVETHTRAVTLFPDRVLAIGSVVMLGDEEVLEGLSPHEIKNPLLISAAVTIKSQSTIAEFGWPQKASYPIFHQDEHLTIEVHC